MASTLVVMAAGIGKRYGGLKQIDPVGPTGEIVIDYSVFDALRAGFGKVVFIIRRDIEQAFRERVGRGIEAHAPVAYVFQELNRLPPPFRAPPGRTKPWGTAHAVLLARDEVPGPFAVVNADDFYGPGAFKLLADFLASARDRPGRAAEFAMVAYVLRNTLTEHGHVARGVCTVGPDGYLETIAERTKIKPFGDKVKYAEEGDRWIEVPADSPVSMNMWGFTPAVFDELAARFRRFLEERGQDMEAECYVPVVVGEMVREGRARVRVLRTDEQWYGVTYQADRPALKAFIQEQVRRGRYPARLWG